MFLKHIHYKLFSFKINNIKIQHNRSLQIFAFTFLYLYNLQCSTFEYFLIKHQQLVNVDYSLMIMSSNLAQGCLHFEKCILRSNIVLHIVFANFNKLSVIIYFEYDVLFSPLQFHHNIYSYSCIISFQVDSNTYLSGKANIYICKYASIYEPVG